MRTMGQLKYMIIRMLGAVPERNFTELKERMVELKNNEDLLLKDYEKFVSSIYTYCGSYPAWKAQQEYRQVFFELGSPLSGSYAEIPKRAELVDIYLGRLVDAFDTLINSVRQRKRGYKDHWGEGSLSERRGDYFLALNETTRTSRVNKPISKDEPTVYSTN